MAMDNKKTMVDFRAFLATFAPEYPVKKGYVAALILEGKKVVLGRVQKKIAALVPIVPDKYIWDRALAANLFTFNKQFKKLVKGVGKQWDKLIELCNEIFVVKFKELPAVVSFQPPQPSVLALPSELPVSDAPSTSYVSAGSNRQRLRNECERCANTQRMYRSTLAELRKKLREQSKRHTLEMEKYASIRGAHKIIKMKDASRLNWRAKYFLLLERSNLDARKVDRLQQALEILKKDNGDLTDNLKEIDHEIEDLQTQLHEAPYKLSQERGVLSRKMNRQMETQSLIDSQDIKLEPSCETTRQMETQSLIDSQDIKLEPGCEDQTVKEEAKEEEENDCETRELGNGGGWPKHEPVIYTDNAENQTVKEDAEEENDCETSELENKGGWPKLEPFVYIDNAEEGQDEGCTQDSSPQVQKADIKERQLTQIENMNRHSFSDTHSDDVLSNRDSSTESGQIFSVCEVNTGLCVTGASSVLVEESKIKTQRKDKAWKSFKCDVCEAGFTRNAHLIRHKRKHTGEKPYKCDVCGAGFTKNGDLIRHRRTHPGEKPYKCDVCGTGFTTNGDLKIHKKTHTSEIPFRCDVCGRVFSSNYYLKIHTRTHTGEKPYKCDVCDKRFTASDCLKTHKIMHTGEKPYKCDICGTKVTTSGHLMYHKKIHTGEKPYKCDARFIKRWYLQRHKSMHESKKVYQCPLCGAGFTTGFRLSIHMGTHTVKSYPCDVCGAKFPTNQRLKMHMRKHAREKPYVCVVI